MCTVAKDKKRFYYVYGVYVDPTVFMKGTYSDLLIWKDGCLYDLSILTLRDSNSRYSRI